MGDRINREAVYRYVIDGLTPWEKLKNVRNFLEDRREAMRMAQIDLEIQELKREKLRESEDPLDKLYLKRAEAQDEGSQDVFQKLQDEIDFLENYERECQAEAEPTRHPGKSDDEMYEINYEFEMATRCVLDFRADLIAYGRPSQETAKKFMRFPPAVRLARSLGHLDEKAVSNLTMEQLSSGVWKDDGAALKAIQAPKPEDSGEQLIAYTHSYSHPTDTE